MKINLFKTKNQVTGWLFSYLVIILSLFIMMAVIVSVYSASLKKETNEFNEFVFESVAASVNDVLLNVNDLHLSLARNENLDKFLHQKGNFHKSQTTYELISDLKAYRQFAANIDYFFIYLKEYDLVLSEDGVSNSFDYYNYYFDTQKISYEEWKNLFYNFEKDQYISLACANRFGEKFDSLGFMFCIELDNPDAVGMILCDKRHFMKNIENLEWKKLCDIYIYNGEGNLVLHNKISEGEDIPLTLKEADKYVNKDNVVFRKAVSNDRYFWQIITVAPKKVLNSEIYIIQSFIVGLVIFAVILLAFLVRYLLKLNRKPIRDVLSLFGVSEEKDEYEVLHRLINETIDRNNNLLKDVEARDRELKTVAISKIIRGDLPHSTFAEYDIEFNWELYSVLSFCLEDISTFFREDTSMPDFERSYHLRYVINNVMEELFLEAGFKIYTTEIDHYVVCLASLADGTVLSEVSELVQKGVSYINTYFNIELIYAISSIYDTFLDLPKAYVKTKDIIEYKRFLNTNVIPFDMKKESGEYNYIFDTRCEERLMYYVKSGNADEAKAILEPIFDEFKKFNKYSMEYIRYVVFDIASTLTKCVNDLTQSIDFAIKKLYKQIHECVDIDSMQGEIERYIENICENVSLVRKKKYQKFSVDDIVKYVHDNLTDTNLGVASIGEYFNLTGSYASRLFKESMHISLTDYIARMRVRLAQKLISEGEYSIIEVSEMVGFNNDRAFYRAQKKFGKL